jgi:hypothetical protein
MPAVERSWAGVLMRGIGIDGLIARRDHRSLYSDQALDYGR